MENNTQKVRVDGGKQPVAFYNHERYKRPDSEFKCST